MRAVAVGLLGPLELRLDDRLVLLSGAKPRELVAALALNANQAVSVGSLVEVLWGEPAPDRAEHTLQQHVSAVRKMLAAVVEGSDDEPILVTRAPGYCLRVDVLDVRDFEADAAQGYAAAEAKRWIDARDAFGRALRHWRGDALADVRNSDRLTAAAVRLEEQRLGVLEAEAEARLESGDARTVVPELEHLVSEYPLRERLRGLLMLGLYRSGRQADALAAYQDARRALIDELGIEPGPALRELEQAILLQRADLTVSPASELHATFRADTRVSAGRIELPDGQAVLLIEGTFSIGRDPSAAVRLVDNRVSRHHAEIVVAGDAVLLRDLRSTNGTTVNGEEVTRERTLIDGDVLGIGGVDLRYHAGN